MLKILALGVSSLLSLAVIAAQPPDEERGGPPPPPPPPKTKKGAERPEDDLRQAYQLLRRLRADGRASGRPEERLKDWTERASKLYRDAIKAHNEGDERAAHEYSIAAHDLARAVEHSRNAAIYEERDDDLPAPPGDGPGGDSAHVRHDLWRAHDRIQGGLADREGEEDKFYLSAARDLYNAARRDAEAGRNQRAGELAKAADAITHVPEHIAHAKHEGPPPPRDRDEPPRAKRDRPDEKRPPREGEQAKPKRKGADGKRARPPGDDGGPRAKRDGPDFKRAPGPRGGPEGPERETLPPPL